MVTCVPDITTVDLEFEGNGGTTGGGGGVGGGGGGGGGGDGGSVAAAAAAAAAAASSSATAATSTTTKTTKRGRRRARANARSAKEKGHDVASEVKTIDAISVAPSAPAFLVVACDGLWDEMTGDDVAELLGMALRRRSEAGGKSVKARMLERAAKVARKGEDGDVSAAVAAASATATATTEAVPYSPADAAELLARAAYAKGSMDNITVVVVDLAGLARARQGVGC